MSAPNDGGTAFPSALGDVGMTLRDYFAAAALPQCQVDTVRHKDDPRTWHEIVAREAFKLADAMLRERKLS